MGTVRAPGKPVAKSPNKSRKPAEPIAHVTPTKRPRGAFNITHTELVWPGKYDERGHLVEPPRVSLPLQVIEVIEEGRTPPENHPQTSLPLFGESPVNRAENGWRNKLIRGDNLLVLASLLEEFAGKIDLIYIDPPFATGTNFSFTTPIGEELFEATKDPSVIDQKAYRDTWPSGVQYYLVMIAKRLSLMRDLLSSKGSLFVHLDWRLNHLVRIVLDEVFGSECFVNEIVVNRGRRKNLQSQFARILSLGSEHDVLLLYSKRPDAKYQHVRSKSRAKEAQWQSFWRGNFERPTMRYQLLGFEPTHGQFLWSKSRAERAVRNYQDFLKSGEPDLIDYWEKTGKELEFIAMFPGRAYPQYWLPPKQTGLIGDVWTDIQSYSYRWGYETEKHEALLTRVIEMASGPNDLVADFFCGSGTTMAVAEKLGRRWIGCDIGRFAVLTTHKRLLDVRVKDSPSGKERGCRPFEVLDLGRDERKYWQTMRFGNKSTPDEQSARRAYVKFILDLYQARPIQGTDVHGEKGNALIQVSAVDAAVTIASVERALSEVQRLGARELHVLGWEFEIGLQNRITWDVYAQRGVTVRLLSIPRETMDKRAVEAGEVRFFDLAYIEVEVIPDKISNKTRSIKLALRDFILHSTELVPGEASGKIKKWSDYVDYWAVDWNFRGNAFVHRWQAFRTPQNRSLPLESETHVYDTAATYQIRVKVVDIFGNDTNRLITWEVN
jgi:DNA modification methylase